MRQPGGAGPGCMVYPFDPKGTCSTQPRVTLHNITLEDINIHKSLLYPVTMRCNVSNPCTQINLINVKTDSWQIGQKDKGYVCQFVSGKGRNNQPKIDCLDEQNIDQLIIQQNIDNRREQYFEQKNSWMNIDKQRQLIKNEMNRYLRQQKWKWDNKQQYVRILRQIEQAVLQMKYIDTQDDQFSYDIKQIQDQYLIQNEYMVQQLM